MVDINVSAFREFNWTPKSVAAAVESSTALGSRGTKSVTMTLDDSVRLKIVGSHLKYTSDGHLKSGTVTAVTILIAEGDTFLKAVAIDGFAFDIDGKPGGYLFKSPVFTFEATHFIAPTGTKGVEFTAAGGADLVTGSKGYDDLYGGGGNDTIHGGKSNDLLDGGKGNDHLFGDENDDFLAGGPGNDTLDGGKGSDWVYAPALGDQHPTKAIKIDLAKGTVTKGYGTDTLKSIENAAGGDGNDTVTGSSGANKLQGQGGNDVVDGGKGDDTITGNAGVDTLKGGAGKDDFVFNWRNADADKVVDFTPGVDHIVLDKALFAKLDLGVVSADHFSSDGTPDGDDYLVYDPSTGKLFYDDQEGDGQTLIATLGNMPGLNAADMIIANSSQQDYWF